MINTNLEEIIGDSTGKEAREKIMEWVKKNYNYGKYYSPTLPRHGKSLAFEVLNCYDGDNPRIKDKKRGYIEKLIKEHVMEK